MPGNIYLFSDDSFFSYGLSVLIEESNGAFKIFTDDMCNYVEEIHKRCTCRDVVIIAINNLKESKRVTETIRQSGMRALFLFDIPCTASNTWQYGYWSKKSAVGDFFSVIQHYMNDNTGAYPLMTLSERQVLTRLAEGKSPEKVSREMYVPVKTVYSRKCSAIKGIGMHSLNALSILLAERLLFKTVQSYG